MTLTTHDLEAIGKQTSKIISTSLKPIKSDLSAIKTDIKVLKTDIKVLRTDVKELKSDVKFLKDATVEILSWADDIHRTLVKDKLPQRVERIEKHLDLPHSL